MFHKYRLLSLYSLALLCLTAGCDRSTSDSTTSTNEAKQQPAKPDQSPDQPDPDDHPDVFRGRVSPGEITESFGAWRKRAQEARVDESSARALKQVPPGAEVTVYFATWCSDSRREVPRLWRALEAAGGDVPFSVEYIAVDRQFEAGEVSVAGADLEFVPTFVVNRDGGEVGRIVESSPNDLVGDLHALLTGDKEGVLSGRQDL